MISQSTSRRGPRVMHVITPSRMAGAETFLARLLRRGAGSWGLTAGETFPQPLAASPRPPVFHCVSSRGRAIDEMRAAGVDVEELGISGKGNLLAAVRILRAATRFEADLIHSHLSTASWWSGWLETFGGPPSIGHVHGFTSARWHSRQSHLLACSQAVKADLVAKRISADRVTVLHYPVDPEDVRPTRSAAAVRAELGATSDTPVVGTFAHLSQKKGYRELVRAAEIVLRKLPNAQFWCFGEGPLRGELEQFSESRGFADRFRLFGFRRDVPDMMQAVDVMCLPSHREPFGLVYVEAALTGRPVIACDAGGAAEIIEHGVTGLLVPPPGVRNRGKATADLSDNVEPLAESILTLFRDRALAQQFGERGRENALDRFGWPAYLSGLADLYDRVLGQESPTTASVGRLAG
jgi:glycosyltransferase involved in cell wall biosynthesis